MFSVTILCVGSLKEAYLRDACREYEKRLSGYCRVQVLEIAEEKIPENPSGRQIEAALQKEGQRILAKIPNGAAVSALCIEGKNVSSTEFSEWLEKRALQSVSRLCFIIGGSYGLADEVKKAASLCLSMSRMTFPHQLARVMLLEQLYRAFQISSGGKYHK